MMKPINTSICDFPATIAGGCVYVDKMAMLYELAKPGADILCYLPRPRRFGTSLIGLSGTVPAGVEFFTR